MNQTGFLTGFLSPIQKLVAFIYANASQLNNVKEFDRMSEKNVPLLREIIKVLLKAVCYSEMSCGDMTTCAGQKDYANAKATDLSGITLVAQKAHTLELRMMNCLWRTFQFWK